MPRRRRCVERRRVETPTPTPRDDDDDRNETRRVQL
jgi:hypothetical protein